MYSTVSATLSFGNMGYYRDSLERLKAEYGDRTSISIFGRQATMLRLLVDSYEVGLRFKRLLEEMKKGPILIEDADLNYREWTEEKNWMEFNDLGQSDKEETAALYGFSNKSPFPQTYANHIQDVLGSHIKDMDMDRFKLIVSSVVTTSDVIPDVEIEKVIEDNIRQLKNTLIEIDKFKTNQKWEKNDFAQFYQNIYHKYEKLDKEKFWSKEGHQNWLKGIVVEPDFEDYEQRRRELLLDLFKTDFLKPLRRNIHVPATDDLNFNVLQDDEMMPNLTDTLKWYAAFKKLCPRNKEGMFNFDEHATLGQYIYNNNIPLTVCNAFLFCVIQMQMVQKEMHWLEHPEDKPQEEDATLKKFVEKVETIMLKAEDRNGEVIEYEDNKHNKCQYTFNVDGKLFCSVMDEIQKNYPDQIDDYLDGKKGESAIGVTKVSQFIGCVVGLHIFNKEDVRNKDFEPAFQYVFGDKNEKGQRPSYIPKMSAPKEIKNKSIFETIKALCEEKKNELLQGNNKVIDILTENQ